MNVALNNLIMPAPTAVGSEKVSSKPKGQADKTAKPEAKSAQAEKSAHSKDAPDIAKKSKAQSGPKAPGGKEAKVKKGEKIVVEAMGQEQVFSEIIQSAQASEKLQKVVAGELLNKKDAGNAGVVLADKAHAGKGDTNSAQVRASTLGRTQVAQVANKPVLEGQAVATSEIVEKAVVGNLVGKDSIVGNPVGEIPLDAEPAALHRKPIEITEALAEAVSSGAGAEAGKSQVGLGAMEVSQKALTSPTSPVLPALAEGMKQVSDATRAPAHVAGEKSALTASSVVTGRKVLSTAGLTSNVSSGSPDGANAGNKIDTLLRDSGGTVTVAGQRPAGGGETSQEVLQHIGTASEPVHFDTADAPTVSSGNSLPAQAANQVVEALRASAEHGGQQVVIRLNPPELGKVSIRLNVTGDEVRGVLKVDNPQTLTHLQREAPALLGRLAEAGVQLKQMDLSLNQQGTNDSALYSQLRDQSNLWQGSGQDDNQQASANESPSDEHVPVGVEEASREMTTLADDAINVWI